MRKAISNGFPMAAIIGTKKVMQAAQDTFISSTYWTDRIGPAAALATIDKLIKNDVYKHLGKTGRDIKEGWQAAADRHGLKIDVSGIDPLGHFSFRYREPLVLKTLFTQQMLEKGFLATTAFYASYAHKESHVKSYLTAVDETFCLISEAIRKKKPGNYLKSAVSHSGFKRLT